METLILSPMTGLSNLTVAVSFGLEREAAFEQVKTKTVVYGGSKWLCLCFRP